MLVGSVRERRRYEERSHTPSPRQPPASKTAPSQRLAASRPPGPTMSGDPEIIFTFDDGPNPKTTPAVLDTLAKHHIHAVFFLVRRDGWPRQAGARDHRTHARETVTSSRNHTMTHQDLCRLKDEDPRRQGADRSTTARQTIEEGGRASRRCGFARRTGCAATAWTGCSTSATSRTSTGTSTRRSGSTATRRRRSTYVEKEVRQDGRPQRAY